jgi:cytochrome c-type biogenesis protein CcmH
MRALALALFFAVALAATGAGAGISAAAEPRASLPDIEDEVMCLQCGTPLNLSNAPVADREREFIRRQIARGRTKQQIKDALVARFGPSVLAEPEDEGFGLAAYLVPALAVLLALVAVVAAARRWRAPAKPAAAPPELEPAEARRLERELAAYDPERSDVSRPPA